MPKRIRLKNLPLLLFPVLSLVIVVFNPFSPLHVINSMIAVVLLMAGWWISEAVPIAVTSLLPVVLFPLLGIMDGGKVAAEYFNDIIFLFMGGFILSMAMEKWNLHLKIAYKALMLFGSKPYRILFGFMFTSSFLSMWMSNTATAVIMLPIALSVANELELINGKDRMKKFKVGLLIGIAYGCSIGGITTLIGTPPNLAFAAIFKNMYPMASDISFASWFLFALPLNLILLSASSYILYILFKPEIKSNSSFNDFIRNKNIELGPATYEQRMVLTAFITFALLLIFKSDIVIGSFHIPGWNRIFINKAFIKDGTIAIFISVLLFVTATKNQEEKRLMNWNTAVKMPWAIILLFGGGFALAKGAVTSGLTSWVGEGLLKYASTPLVFFVGVNATFMTLITTFTSNVSTAQILLPAAGALSESMHLDPRLLMITMTFASSFAFILPIATPPNAIVFGSGEIRIKEMVLPGVILSLIGIILLIFLMFHWGIKVFQIDINSFPEWALPK